MAKVKLFLPQIDRQDKTRCPRIPFRGHNKDELYKSTKTLNLCQLNISKAMQYLKMVQDMQNLRQRYRS